MTLYLAPLIMYARAELVEAKKALAEAGGVMPWGEGGRP